jgi:hypothetical protein
MILSNSRTLLEDIKHAKEKGFAEEFIYREDKLIGQNSKLSYSKSNCLLVEYCIHEGLSDPSDQSILFLIETSDGNKGCLSSSYGTYGDADLIEFTMSLKKKNQ